MSLSSFLLKEIERLILLQLDIKSLFRYSVISTEARHSCNSRKFWIAYLSSSDRHDRITLFKEVILGDTIYTSKLSDCFDRIADYYEKEQLIFEYYRRRWVEGLERRMDFDCAIEISSAIWLQEIYKPMVARVGLTHQLFIHYSPLERKIEIYRAFLNFCYRIYRGEDERQAVRAFVDDCGDDLVVLNQEIIADVLFSIFGTDPQNLHRIFDSDLLYEGMENGWSYLLIGLTRRIGELWDSQGSIIGSSLLNYYTENLSLPAADIVLEQLTTYLPSKVLRAYQERSITLPMNIEWPGDSTRLNEKLEKTSLAQVIDSAEFCQKIAHVYKNDPKKLIQTFDRVYGDIKIAQDQNSLYTLGQLYLRIYICFLIARSTNAAKIFINEYIKRWR